MERFEPVISLAGEGADALSSAADSVASTVSDGISELEDLPGTVPEVVGRAYDFLGL